MKTSKTLKLFFNDVTSLTHNRVNFVTSIAEMLKVSSGTRRFQAASKRREKDEREIFIKIYFLAFKRH